MNAQLCTEKAALLLEQFYLKIYAQVENLALVDMR